MTNIKTMTTEQLDAAIEKAQYQLDNTFYDGPYSYQSDKDYLRELRAAKAGKKPHELDPAGAWYCVVSN